MDWTHIPLLSGRPFREFTPTEFKLHVKGLFRKYVARKSTVRQEPKEFSFALNKKGTLVIRIRRNPKWLAPEEINRAADELGLSAQRLWAAVAEREIPVMSREAAQDAAEFPW